MTSHLKNDVIRGKIQVLKQIPLIRMLLLFFLFFWCNLMIANIQFRKGLLMHGNVARDQLKIIWCAGDDITGLCFLEP